jgi:aspartate/methionine/tyrosine aminotransferase
LISTFNSWLEQQQEPLHYDTGEKSGRREIILASGGIIEALRILLFALSSYLETVPARILSYRCELLPQFSTIPNLLFETLSPDEGTAQEQTAQFLEQSPEMPTFLLLGDIIGEETRRRLWALTIEHPLFIIEANNAPNHLSLAREAKLVQRVIRLLTPAIFAPRLQNYSTVFIAGNADFLNVMENVHFNIERHTFVAEVGSSTCEQNLAQLPEANLSVIPTIKPSPEGWDWHSAENDLPGLAERVERTIERVINDRTQKLSRTLDLIEYETAAFTQRLQQVWRDGLIDEFSAIDTKELLDQLVQFTHEPAWCMALEHSYLSAFVKHQPQYRLGACMVVSGSSRTALGILGFHCGITDVVIPDLSWSYEQCFQCHAVPLTPALGRCRCDDQKLEQLQHRDPTWHEHGAVAINNPHNATGRIFAETAMRRLIAYCLQHGIHLIDDLAYQDVAPVDDLPKIKTVRQLASEMVHLGEVNDEQANLVITVHSISKTDCLAGARLAVIEIRDAPMRQRFEALNSTIKPNLAAIFIGYLFYRGTIQATRTYWHLRNAIFEERTQALLAAVENLPPDRNPFDLTIIPPMGSMYPLLQIKRLPSGLSLDWLASNLARRGIGLLPLATFARTEAGFETGRTTFRLTLGGVDNAEVLLAKTRHLLIDFNRLIAQEESHYNRKRLPTRVLANRNSRSVELGRGWAATAEKIIARRQVASSAG